MSKAFKDSEGNVVEAVQFDDNWGEIAEMFGVPSMGSGMVTHSEGKAIVQFDVNKSLVLNRGTWAVLFPNGSAVAIPNEMFLMNYTEIVPSSTVLPDDATVGKE